MSIIETVRERFWPSDNDWVVGILQRWGGNFSRSPQSIPDRIELPPDDELGCVEQIKLMKQIADQLGAMCDCHVEFLAGIMVALESQALSQQVLLELLRERLPTKNQNNQRHKNLIEAVNSQTEQIAGRLVQLSLHLTGKEPMPLKIPRVIPWDGSDDSTTDDFPLWNKLQPPLPGGSGGGGGGGN